MATLEKYELNEQSGEIERRTLTEVEFNNVVPIDLGSNEPKYFADAHIGREDQEKYVGTYVLREFQSKETALHYLDIVLELKAAGVPVPNTTRYHESDGKYYLVVSDLTQSGKNELWSVNNDQEQLRRTIQSEADLRNVTEQLENISKRAGNIALVINADNYFIIRDPQGELQVMVGDIGKGLARVGNIPDRENMARIANEAAIKQLGDHIRRIVH